MDHKNLSYYKAFYNTPTLWTGELDGLKQFVFPEIYFENLDMGSIPSKLRLGHKIEHIFLKLIQHSRQYKVIAHNIPIRKEKVSLGEIDFLLQDVDSHQFSHVELTYKFYVISEESTNIELQFIGPNQRDSFKAKKERIINHQIPLLKTPEATSVLLRFNIKPFNSNCISGRWIPFHTFKFPEFFKYQYYLPSKQEWLLDPQQGVNWLGHKDVLDLITVGLENKNAPLLWMKSSDFTIEKLFIVWW